uniref:Glabrous enhancer-binding protein-like DBD domain-containing protein n=1 Tax=Rhizophora mucronata TaxID=61149 RepID=A0A2P2IJ98_RHIMU
MALEQNDTVFDQGLDDDDESSQDDDEDIENDDVLVNEDVLADEEDEEDINYVSPSTSSPAAVPIAVPSASVVTVAVPNGGDDALTAVTGTASEMKRQRVGSDSMSIVMQEEKKPPPPPPPQLDESRRLFQRLWTDEDEIELLRGFLDYTTQRGGNHHDTALFYDQIKSKLQLDFNKNQLVEKLRRLKKKYRNIVNKISSGKDFSFKSPHDQATFEISRKIWSNAIGKIGVEDGNLDDEDGNPNPHATPSFNNGELVKIDDQKSTPKSRKRSRARTAPVAVKFDDTRVMNDAFVATNDHNNNGNSSNSNAGVSGLIEETVRSCLSPLLKELLSNMTTGPYGGRGIGGLAMNAMPLSFERGEMMVDEKWRKQQILELEVYSKRLELVQDQIKAQLKELQSMGG